MASNFQYKHVRKEAMRGRGGFERVHVEVEVRIHEDETSKLVTSFVAHLEKQGKRRRAPPTRFSNLSTVYGHYWT